MTIIQQGSLFDLQKLYDSEPTQRFEVIFQLSILIQSFMWLRRSHVWVGLLNLTMRDDLLLGLPVFQKESDS